MTTPKIDLEEIAENQGSKYVTHNEALRQLDVLTQPNIIAQVADIPASTFSEGDTYIIASSVASGTWNGQKNNVAYYYNSAWVIVSSVNEGWRFWDNNLGLEVIYQGGAWVPHITDGIASSTFTDKGQLLVATANATVSVLPIGSPGQVLKVDALGSTVEWGAVAGTGDVTGPASATANGIPRFSGSTGKAIITSNWTIVSATDEMVAGGDLNMNGNSISSVTVSSMHVKNYTEAITSFTASTGDTQINLDMLTSNVFYILLRANASVTITNPPQAGTNGNITVFFEQDGTGSRTVAMTSVIYASGAASTISSQASAKDIWTFTTIDGGANYFGMTAGRKFS